MISPSTNATNGSSSVVLRRVVLGLFMIVLSVHASIAVASCTASTQAVVFGNYDVFSQAALQGVGGIEVSCSPAATYSISLSTGNGSFQQREMLGGGAILYYNLFTSAAYSVVWGDGSGASSTVAGTGELEFHTIYGLVPAGQNLRAGNYTDTIVVTINF